MTFTFNFTEDQINFIWRTLTDAHISGKDAPILTSIFVNIKDAVNYQTQIANSQENQSVEDEKSEQDFSQQEEKTNPVQ